MSFLSLSLSSSLCTCISLVRDAIEKVFGTEPLCSRVFVIWHNTDGNASRSTPNIFTKNISSVRVKQEAGKEERVAGSRRMTKSSDEKESSCNSYGYLNDGRTAQPANKEMPKIVGLETRPLFESIILMRIARV